MAGLAQWTATYSILVIQDFSEAIYEICSRTHKGVLLSMYLALADACTQIIGQENETCKQLNIDRGM